MRNQHFRSRELCSLLVLLFAAATGCSGEPADGPEDAGLRVARGAVAPSVLLTGELVAEDSVRLIVPNVNVWPLQLRWIAEDGAQVEASDPVVEFDNSQLTGNLEGLRSEVVAAANRLSQARSQAASDEASAFFGLEDAKAAWEKAKLAAALPRDLGSEQEWARRRLELEKAAVEMEDARLALDSVRAESQAAVDVARLDLEKAEMELARAEEGIAAVTLVAPRDGILLVDENGREGRPYRSGDTLWPGMTVATLPDLSTLRAEAVLFDVDDGRVAPGLDVVVRLDAFPGERLSGEVTEVSPVAEQEGRSARRAFTVLVDVEGVDAERMRPGMSVQVEATIPAREGLVIPRSALAFEDDAGGLAPRARLAGGTWAEVEVGVCDAFACLLEAGLAEGTRLARAGHGEGGRG